MIKASINIDEKAISIINLSAFTSDIDICVTLFLENDIRELLLEAENRNDFGNDDQINNLYVARGKQTS